MGLHTMTIAALRTTQLHVRLVPLLALVGLMLASCRDTGYL